MKRRTLFIAEEVWIRLVALSKTNGGTVSELVRRAIVEFLNREEK